MAVEISPHIAPDQLKAAIETAEKRELDWLVEELHETLTNIKHGLEDCYALLAPIEPGSTLVLSTPRNEVVKGTVTRVGTRIVKGFHLSIQDSSLVLWLRTLEPADAPVAFGTKLALAIGTTRRLEHDESEKIFGYCCDGDDNHHHSHHSPPGVGSPSLQQQQQQQQQAVPLSGSRKKTPGAVDVYVREKVRVESADPSLLSLSAKLMALGHTLALARRNLAAVMGEEWEGDD